MFSFDFEINSVGSVLLNKEAHLLSVLSIAIDDSFTLKSIPPDSLSLYPNNYLSKLKPYLTKVAIYYLAQSTYMFTYHCTCTNSYNY